LDFAIQDFQVMGLLQSKTFKSWDYLNPALIHSTLLSS
jgi:hypothetical protein